MKEKRETLVVEGDGAGVEGGGEGGIEAEHGVIVGVAIDTALLDGLEHLRRGYELLRAGDERVGGDRLFDELLAPLEVARFEKLPGYAQPALCLLSPRTAAAGIHGGLWRLRRVEGGGVWRSEPWREIKKG